MKLFIDEGSSYANLEGEGVPVEVPETVFGAKRQGLGMIEPTMLAGLDKAAVEAAVYEFNALEQRKRDCGQSNIALYYGSVKEVSSACLNDIYAAKLTRLLAGDVVRI